MKIHWFNFEQYTKTLVDNEIEDDHKKAPIDKIRLRRNFYICVNQVKSIIETKHDMRNKGEYR
jgi:hypothetical protein